MNREQISTILLSTGAALSIYGAAGVSVVVPGMVVGAFNKNRQSQTIEEQQRNRLYDAASFEIENLDGKIGTSHEDWARAYDEVMGWHYDVHTSNPQRDLRDQDLRDIIDKYSSPAK